MEKISSRRTSSRAPRKTRPRRPHSPVLPPSLQETLVRELLTVAHSLRATTATSRRMGTGHLVVLEGPHADLRAQAAKTLANALGKDVHRIDLSSVISSYVGETEKNLDRAFAAAKQLQGVLLIDEADALFQRGRPTPRAVGLDPVRDLNRLLGRLRRNSGIAILSAAHIRKIDPSMLDALRAIVHLSGKRVT